MDSKKLKAYAKQIKGESGTLDRSLIVRVVGVSFDGRQDFLAKMNQETKIKLERDRRNEHDFYAVKVLAELDGKWEHVGFVPQKMSRKISFSLDNGVALVSSVHRVTGGTTCQHTGEDFNFGLEISVKPEFVR